MTARDDHGADLLFYVQHLLGTGHLQRAAAIARATAAAGLDTVLVSGGLPLAGLDVGAARLAQLEPVRAKDQSFTELIDAEGRVIDEAFKTRRAEALRALFEELRPRVLMTEMFPFGRRQMRFELLPLIEQARGLPARLAVVCSLRDVLTTHKQPGKTEWMLEAFARLYDAALVHGDPAVLPLERSFPRATELAGRLHYTGYVLSAPGLGAGAGDGDGDGEILVSTGGGAVAGPLIEAALAVRPRTALAERPWRILIGANYPEADFRAVVARAPAGVAVERARPDFRDLLARAHLSISQGGYNTTLDVLAAKVPAVIVPFTARGETEQGLRARVLAERGLLSVVEEDPLTPEALLRGVGEALARAPRGLAGLDTGGAEETVRLLRAMAKQD